MQNTLITVKSARAAIKIDTFCAQNTIACKTIATPETVSSECGISLLVDEKACQLITVFAQQNNIEIKIYDRFTEI